MNRICIDENWTFRRGFLDSPGMLKEDPGITVNLPHDGMIGTAVTPDAPARADMGYFTGGLCNYTKNILISREWENECVCLLFDGAMMNASVDVNGCKAGSQHYGYAPFVIDLTDLVAFGAEIPLVYRCRIIPRRSSSSRAKGPYRAGRDLRPYRRSRGRLCLPENQHGDL